MDRDTPGRGCSWPHPPSITGAPCLPAVDRCPMPGAAGRRAQPSTLPSPWHLARYTDWRQSGHSSVAEFRARRALGCGCWFMHTRRAVAAGAERGSAGGTWPERYDPWQTFYERFARWERDGTWARPLEHVQTTRWSGRCRRADWSRLGGATGRRPSHRGPTASTEGIITATLVNRSRGPVSRERDGFGV